MRQKRTFKGDRSMGEIREITEKMMKFREERDWKQFHNHKDVALSLVLEAAEVLEHFQWKSPEEVVRYGKECKDEIADELADVAWYLFELAHDLDIDLPQAIERKTKKNAAKYPVEKCKGRHTKYNKL
jgi:dCTP diphosphatase